MNPEVLKNLTNPGAELALLGSVLRAKKEQRVQIALRVREQWLSSADSIAVWRVMGDFINASKPIDLTLLDDALRSELPDLARQSIVEKIGSAMPTASAWPMLADLVENYFIRRRGYEVSQAAAAQFLDLKTPPLEALETVEAEYFSLHAKKEGAGMQHVSKILPKALESIMESIANRGYVTGGWPTGFTDLDRSYIKGMRPGHVIMIVSPPGGGKTVGMMKLARNRAMGIGDYEEYNKALERAAEGQHHLNYLPCNVGIYSWEQDGPALLERLLITESRVEMAKMHRGQVSRAEQDAIARAQNKIIESRMFIEHVPGLSIQDLRVKARYDVMRYKLEMICIDYAQLITSHSRAAQGNRTQEMMDVSKGLDMLAEECGVPVIVCAQPKQETWGSRAGLNAMAETAQLAKDADLVIMLGFWDKIANQIEGLEKKTKADLMGDDDGFEDRDADDPTVYAYMDIVKNRHGPNTTGKPPIKLRWDRDFYDFVSTNKRLFDSTGKEHQR
jgi:replicative DNA helicase